MKDFLTGLRDALTDVNWYEVGQFSAQFLVAGLGIALAFVGILLVVRAF